MSEVNSFTVTDVQLQQEENIRYVAYTRAKRKLGFITIKKR